MLQLEGWQRPQKTSYAPTTADAVAADAIADAVNPRTLWSSVPVVWLCLSQARRQLRSDRAVAIQPKRDDWRGQYGHADDRRAIGRQSDGRQPNGWQSDRRSLHGGPSVRRPFRAIKHRPEDVDDHQVAAAGAPGDNDNR